MLSTLNVTLKYHCLVNHWGNESVELCGEESEIIGKYISLIYFINNAYIFSQNSNYLKHNPVFICLFCHTYFIFQDIAVRNSIKEGTGFRKNTNTNVTILILPVLLSFTHLKCSNVSQKCRYFVDLSLAKLWPHSKSLNIIEMCQLI